LAELLPGWQYTDGQYAICSACVICCCWATTKGALMVLLEQVVKAAAAGLREQGRADAAA
jgi:hypothetical protein